MKARRTAILVAAVLGAVGGTLLLVLLSPFILIWVGAIRAEDWNRLSAIGQTYGAASAVLSALALGGVAVSLLVQSRDGRAQQAASVREFHRELLELTFSEPHRLLPSWGWNLGEDVSEDLARQIMFAHMICNYMALGYELEVTSERQLRQLTLKHLFDSDIGRMYWERMGRETSSGRTGKMIQRFTRIAEDEYRRAVEAGPPAIRTAALAAGRAPRPVPAPGRSRGLLTAAGAAAGMIMVGAKMAHRRQP